MPREVKYEGHRANSGGLQGHSLGDDYPFAVVGCLVERLGSGEAPSEHTRYFILDCSNGKTYVKATGRTYATAVVAHIAARFLAGNGDMPYDWMNRPMLVRT